MLTVMMALAFASEPAVVRVVEQKPAVRVILPSPYDTSAQGKVFTPQTTSSPEALAAAQKKAKQPDPSNTAEINHAPTVAARHKAAPHHVAKSAAPVSHPKAANNAWSSAEPVVIPAPSSAPQWNSQSSSAQRLPQGNGLPPRPPGLIPGERLQPRYAERWENRDRRWGDQMARDDEESADPRPRRGWRYEDRTYELYEPRPRVTYEQRPREWFGW